MRPAMPAPRQNTATLRRSSCFRCGRLGASLRSARLRALSACRRCTTLHIFPKASSTRLTLRYAWPPLLASSRPGGKPYDRPCTFPSGMRPIVVPFPLRGTAFARCASRCRRAPSLAALVRTEPQGSDKAKCIKAQRRSSAAPRLHMDQPLLICRAATEFSANENLT